MLAQEVDAGVSAGLELGLKRLDGFGELQRRDFLLGVLDRVEVNRGRLVAVFRLPDEPSVEITLPRYWSPNRGKH